MTKHVAIVSGASRGIGAAIAEKLMLQGWLVVGFDTSWKDSSAHHVLDRQVVDVADYKMVSEAIGLAERALGPIGLVVNNAGITRDAACHKMEPEDFETVLRVNLMGAFHLCRAVLGKMRQRAFGRIINISSMNALRGQAGQANYAAAKAGLIAMTKSIALENASRNITANCIAPGFIRTQMTSAMPAAVLDAETARIPVSRIGRPEDIAAAVEFLASDKASFITGQVLSVNGGQLMT